MRDDEALMASSVALCGMVTRERLRVTVQIGDLAADPDDPLARNRAEWRAMDFGYNRRRFCSLRAQTRVLTRRRMRAGSQSTNKLDSFS